MTAWAALLRGINVGGRRRVPMAELRALAEELGFAAVGTYVQSGNLVFTADGDAQAVTGMLEAALESHFGFEIPVVLRSGAEMERITRRHPFGDRQDDPARLHVFFLAGDPDPARVAAWDPGSYMPDEAVVDGREVYVHFPNGMGRSKFTFDFGTPATARNWRTVLALREMLAGLPGR